MSTSRRTSVFVHFPSTGQIYEENVNYEDTVYQFVSRLLQSSNINNSDDFKLYSIDKKALRFRPEESCSAFFGIHCRHLILTRSELVNVDFFFENHYYNVVYDTSSPAMTFIDNAIHLLQSSSSKFAPPLTKSDGINYYFALYDPVADIIIKSTSPLNTNFVVLKRFEYIAPGYVFDFSQSKDFYGKLSNCSFESNATSNFIKQFRSYHRREHLSGIDFIEFTEERAHFLFDSFRNKLFDKNEVTLSEQINFLFTILSLAKQPYIPLSLQKMIISAMELEDDRKIFYIAKAIAVYIPLSTHLVLEELFQFFGTATIEEESWNVISLMLTDLLFETKTEDREENYTEDIEDPNKGQYVYESSVEKNERERETFIKFTRFLLLYFKQIFNLKENIGRRNSIRMIKKIPKCESKGSMKCKKEKKAKGDKKAKKKKGDNEYSLNIHPDNDNSDEAQSNDDNNSQNEPESEIKKEQNEKKKTEDQDSDEKPKNDNDNGSLHSDIEEPKRSRSDRQKKENKLLSKVQKNKNNSDSETANKRSKSAKKAKNYKKKKSEIKSDEDNIIKKSFSLDTKERSKVESKSADDELQKNTKKLKQKDQIETSEKSEIDNENYTFILYEEMKPQQMITRTINGFIDINIDETIEFVPDQSIFQILSSHIQKEEEELKEQDLSSEIDELNDIITILKVKFNSAVYADQAASPNSKERKPLLL